MYLYYVLFFERGSMPRILRTRFHIEEIGSQGSASIVTALLDDPSLFH